MNQEFEFREILFKSKNKMTAGFRGGFDNGEELEFGEKVSVQTLVRGFGDESEEIEKGL